MKLSYAAVASIFASTSYANYLGTAGPAAITPSTVECGTEVDIELGGYYAIVSKTVFESTGCGKSAVIGLNDGSTVKSTIVGMLAEGDLGNLGLSDAPWKAIGGDGKESIGLVGWWTTD